MGSRLFFLWNKELLDDRGNVEGAWENYRFRNNEPEFCFLQ